MSVTKEQIAACLRDIGIRDGARLFVHSSLSAFGHVAGGARVVVTALLSAAGPSGTVVVPTFTWGNNNAREAVTFDVRNDVCETGAIPEALRAMSGALRSEHVCHSVAALGPEAPAVMGEGVLPFGKGSSMYRLYELDFKYVFLGVGFECCTALHTVEELMQVPYRIYRRYHGSTVIRADGSRVPSRAREFLRVPPFRNDFARMHGVFDAKGVLRSARVGGATVTVTDMRAIVDIGVDLLSRDIGYLLTDASRLYLESWGGVGERHA